MFDYELPFESIAQRHAGRGKSRLLWANKDQIRDEVISSLPQILRPDDILVFNNSKVIPTRFFILIGSKEVEVLLLREVKKNIWEALARPMKKLNEGLEFALSPEIDARVLRRTDDQTRILLELSSNLDIIEAIKRSGSMPIPPYIRQGRSDNSDKEQYQTEYAKHEGSVAAPTAGLHFSKEMLSEIVERGINIEYVTLHVSQWSFSQVVEGEQNVSEEFYQINKNTWSKIVNAKLRGQRIIAVGTTTVRALESRALLDDSAESEMLASKLFIKPGFEFKIVDNMITNFHQPNSTHLALVCAFFGQSRIQKIYEHAINANYRFLSYGDACFLEID